MFTFKNIHVSLHDCFELQPVRDLCWDKLRRPVLAVTFASSDQRLFASGADGVVACWENARARINKSVVFVPFA